MYFSLEKTNSAKKKYNVKTNKQFGWIKTIPWSKFGINASDGITHQEVINLQTAVDTDADGLVGLGTLRRVQRALETDYNVVWNPCTGAFVEDVDLDSVQHVLWKGLRVPLFNMSCEVHTYADPRGIDLHFAGHFSRRDRNINAIVAHWGGLNPQHLGRVFANRRASSHFAVGICENTGETGVYQYLDVAHIAWHAANANQNTIGVDICQQPEMKHLGYYKKRGYLVETISNPSAAKGYGPRKIISLDPRIREATTELLRGLSRSFNIPEDCKTVADGRLSKTDLEAGGIFSHFHVDFKRQGKWDVAPWWSSIIESF